MTRALLALLSAVACAAASSLLLRRGMLSVGPLADFRPAALGRYGLRCLREPFLLLGVIAGMAQMALWLVVLSWADLSWALPMTAVEYVLVAALAQRLLAERVGARRWAGIALIGAGVVFLVGSW